MEMGGLDQPYRTDIPVRRNQDVTNHALWRAYE